MNLKSFSSSLKERDFPLDFPGHWIGGKWCQDRRAQALSGSFNPSRGSKLIDLNLSIPLIQDAVNAAEQAQNPLKQLSMVDRLAIVKKFKGIVADYQDEIIEVLRVEVGKPPWEAKVDFDSTYQKLEDLLSLNGDLQNTLNAPYYLANQISALDLQPMGITLAFLPFSTPFATLTQAFASSMIAGCPLIVMSSSHAVLTGILFGYLFEKLDELPNGSVNMLFGNYKFFVKALQDKRIKAVIYSGSREHCDTLRQENVNNLTRQLILQSGGKNSVIVHESADLEEAVRCSLLGATKAAGQLNSSTSRIFVSSAILSEFTDRLVHAVREIQIGPTDDQSEPFMGPLYSQKALDKFLRFQTMAKREAAETLVWGRAVDLGVDGHFASPGLHLFSEFDGKSSYQSNVFMCPDMVIYSYNKIEDAINWSNDTNAPFVTSLFGEEAFFKPYLPSIAAPNVLMNLPTVGVDLLLPVAGKNLCGGHRLNGMGIAMLLSYPQAYQSSQELRARLKSWPKLPK